METVRVHCIDCDQVVPDQYDHWADCTEAPDFVRFQAKAERRYNSGGPLAPAKIGDRTQQIPLARHKCGHWIDGAVLRRNQIDRGEPFPQDVDCRTCKEAPRG